MLEALRALTPATRSVPTRAKTLLAALIAMALLFAFDQLLVNLFGHGKG